MRSLSTVSIFRSIETMNTGPLRPGKERKMLVKKVQDAINAQIGKEMASAYLYLAMSAKAAEQGYQGVARWFAIQYHEEMFHAMKFFRYLQDQGLSPVLETLSGPEVRETGLQAMFERVLAHEKTVTASIHALMALAIEEKDYASQGLLAWYVTEQVEEEKNAADILQELSILGSSSQGAFMLNLELGKRELHVESDFSKI